MNQLFILQQAKLIFKIFILLSTFIFAIKHLKGIFTFLKQTLMFIQRFNVILSAIMRLVLCFVSVTLDASYYVPAQSQKRKMIFYAFVLYSNTYFIREYKMRGINPPMCQHFITVGFNYIVLILDVYCSHNVYGIEHNKQRLINWGFFLLWVLTATTLSIREILKKEDKQIDKGIELNRNLCQIDIKYSNLFNNL
ncbi:Hypothetical_protein [Hexamita inflata]|uniref:Hypothetical_protein n=1 Tax=Hexamita inflata TaxID=28002 RepID=A0AA86NLA8_9EUKA|nr:Hypothetical protein HINF_LOCUS9148 [Hexamita inflata]CAI9963126.1 Hypothetical protein HINF_LOCUS50771 [Hexamita inflata]